jgi:adenylate cyclase
MPNARYLPDQKDVAVPEGATLLGALLEEGIPSAHACGGKARCSTCRVLVLDGLDVCLPRTPEEEKLARHLGFEPSMRLACQTRIRGDVTLRRLVLDCEDEALASEEAGSVSEIPTGREVKVSVMFADIEGYTRFAGRLLPYDVIHSLNRYYHYVGRTLERHGGVINSYAGDGFLAVFGMDGAPGHAVAAVRAGMDLLETVEKVRPYFAGLYGRGFRIRIGIHTGPVIVGRVGYGKSQTTTVIGDTVNFASRIEGANKKLRTRFLISEAVKSQVEPEFATQPCRPVRIRGKRGLHTLFEVLGSSPGVR